MGPARGWGGPNRIGPRRAVLDAAKGGCCFSVCYPVTHDYFLPRPGRLSSKSVPLSRCGPCGSVGRCSKGCTRIPTLAGWCSRCCVDGVVFQKLGWCSKKLSQNPRGSMGWCFKSWAGIPKSCSRIPTLFTTRYVVVVCHCQSSDVNTFIPHLSEATGLIEPKFHLWHV